MTHRWMDGFEYSKRRRGDYDEDPTVDKLTEDEQRLVVDILAATFSPFGVDREECIDSLVPHGNGHPDAIGIVSMETGIPDAFYCGSDVAEAWAKMDLPGMCLDFIDSGTAAIYRTTH